VRARGEKWGIVVVGGEGWGTGTHPMTSFYGTETYAIDHKGRLSVPAAMRRAASQKKPVDSFLLVAGFEGCLALYTEAQWNRIEERLQQLPIGGRKGRAFTRTLLMDACRVTVDAQGRITIPPALMGRAGLGKDAVLLGQVGRIEVWNPDRLKSVLEEAQGQFETLAEDVLGGS
jgi:transcriptional regulator MraZ